MLDRFRQMRDKIHYNASVISDIKHGLQEGENNNGAYFCSYPGFVDCYHIVCRMSERSGQPAFLMLCTLVDSEDVPLTEEAGSAITWISSRALSVPRCAGRFLYTLWKQSVPCTSCRDQAGKLCHNPEPYHQLLFKLRAAGKDFCPL